MIAVLYRTAAVLLVLFAAGHQLGFRRVKPEWGVDGVVGAMKSTTFVVNGFTRSYYDFFAGFGFFVTTFLLLGAVVAWQLGGLSRDALRPLGLLAWALAACMVFDAWLSWRYFFVVPGVLATLVAACLVAAAWLGTRG